MWFVVMDVLRFGIHGVFARHLRKSPGVIGSVHNVFLVVVVVMMVNIMSCVLSVKNRATSYVVKSVPLCGTFNASTPP